MKFNRYAMVVLLAVLAVTAFTAVSAQATGGVTVTVKDVLDSKEAVLPGATVTLSSTQGKVKTATKLTNKNGEARFPVLMAGGGYVVEVQFPGKTPQRRDLTIKVRQNQQLLIVLADEFTEIVEVRASADVIDMDKSDQATTFSDSFIGDLPVAGRFYQNVLTLAPGVQDPDGDGNPIVHGSRARDFKTTVSGISNVDPLTGQQLANVNPASIEEMEVITAGAGPEYGRAQGGFANIIQKQGGNSHEGTADFIFRSSKLDGDGANNRPSEIAPNFETIQPALSLSGPILKDKLWYRLSHEYIKRDDPVDTVSALEVVTNEQQISSDQITWQASARNKIIFKYDANPLDITNAGVSSLRGADAAFNQSFDSTTYSMQWSAPYSPSLYLETVVGYQDAGLGVGPTTTGITNNCLVGVPLFENAQCLDGETGEITGSFPTTFDDDRQRFTMKSEGTYSSSRKILGMDHTIKSGISIENERYFRVRKDLPSIFFFQFSPLGDGDEGGQEEIEPVGVVIGSFTVPEIDEAKATGSTWGLYFRDDMKPRQNMTVTWGFRVDREAIDTVGFTPVDPVGEFEQYNILRDQLIAGGLTPEDAGRDARTQTFTVFEGTDALRTNLATLLGIPPQTVSTFFGPITAQSSFQLKKRRAQDLRLSNTNFAPFIAFNWDPWNNNKTRFGFTAGRKYNNIPLVVPMTEQASLRTNVGATAERVGETWVAEEVASRSKINPAASLNTIRRDLSTPYNDEFTFTVERELWSESSMRLVYINRKFRDQLQDIDINNIPGDFGTCVAATTPGQAPIDFTIQDGLIDDCTGKYLLPDLPPGQEPDPFNPNARIEQPDGVPDLYKLNPFWGPIYEIGNYNFSDYTSYGLVFDRRLYRGWQMTGSYTWSKSIGNGEDFSQGFGDDQSLVDDEFGFQSTDQRHVVKLAATSVTPWNFRLGGSVTWQTGLPYSINDQIVSFDTTIPQLGNFGSSEPRSRVLFPSGQRNDERNAAWWNIDVKATKDLRLGKKVNALLSLEVFNLMNDGTYSIYSRFAGFGRQVNGTNIAQRRFGRSFQFQASFSF